MTPDQPSSLLESISTNDDISKVLLRIIKYEINDGDIKCCTFGTDDTHEQMIIHILPFEPVAQLDIGVWAIIFSYLDQNSLSIFCDDETKDLKRVHTNPVFWTELIHQRFPEYYLITAVGYEWRRVYMNLLNMEYLLNKSRENESHRDKYNSSIYHNLYGMLNSYPELKDYLILNKLLKFNIHYIDILLENVDLRVFKEIFIQCPPDNKILFKQLKTNYFTRSTGIADYILNYEGIHGDGIIVKINADNLNYLIKNANYDYGDPYDEKVFIENLMLLYNKYLNLNNLKDGLRVRLNFMLEFAINFIPDKVIEYMLKGYFGEINKTDLNELNKTDFDHTCSKSVWTSSKPIINKTDLIEFFTNAISKKQYSLVLMVYSNIKYILDISEVNVISEYIKSKIVDPESDASENELEDDMDISQDLEGMLKRIIKDLNSWW